MCFILSANVYLVTSLSNTPLNEVWSLSCEALTA